MTSLCLKSYLRIAAILAAGALAPMGRGAVWVWDGFTGSWSVAENWDVNTVPLGAADTHLVFGGSGAAGYDAAHDLGTLQLHALTLQSSASVEETISGAGTIAFIPGVGTAALTQDGSGAFAINVGISAQTALELGGAGTGVVTLGGVMSGGGFSFTGAHWRLTNTANTFTGGFSIGGGAVLEFAPGSGPVDVRPAASGIFGNNTANDVISLNGGTLKFTTTGATSTSGTGAHITMLITGGGRKISFGTDGGLVDLTNSNPDSPAQHGGTIGWANAGGTLTSGGAFALTLNNTATAVFRFNGGQLGLSNLTDPGGGDWSITHNALRFVGYTGTGPLRVEVTNGALVRAGLASNQTTTINAPVTYRGVTGGDPTSGPGGLVNSGISLTTGRVILDLNNITFASGVTFEGALQVAGGNGAAAIDGNIVLRGNSSASPASAAFFRRATGTAMTSTINEPLGAGTGQAVLWLGRGGNDTLTIEHGGLGVFDARVRMDQTNHHGVLLDATAVISAGGILRIAQSISNFSGFSRLATSANVGDIILRGDVTGAGTTLDEAVLDIRLPAPAANGSALNGIPVPLGATSPAAGSRPFGGTVAEAAHGIIVNGSGFGGLRVETNARPDRLFSATGGAGGALIADPVSNLVKLDAYLTAARLAGVTGSGGYLTPAPYGQTWTFPPGGEWLNSVPVGLRVMNHHPGGVDVSLAGTGAFSHNIAVDAGATLELGAAAFQFGPAVPAAGIGELHAAGAIFAAGGLTVLPGGSISPGMGGAGSVSIGGNVALNGALRVDVAGAAVDGLLIAGSLTLGGASSVVFAPASVFGARDYVLATASEGVSGAFASTLNLPASHVLDYSAPEKIRLLRNTAMRTWSGAAGGQWDAATANWQGPVTYSDGEHAMLDDTDTGTNRTVALAASFSPVSVNVNTASAYTIVSQPGALLTGTGFLVKNGSGTLTVSGPAEFTGGVTVNTGAVRLGADDSLPLVGGVLVAAGATLDLNGFTQTLDLLTVSGSVTGGSLAAGSLILKGASAFNAVLKLTGTLGKTGAPLAIPSPVDLDGGTREIHVAAATSPELTLGGAVSNGGLVKTGAGTLVLSGSANSFAGGTVVNEGILRASAPGTLAAGPVSVAAGASLDLDGKPHALGALENSGSVLTGGGVVSVASLSGSGTLNFGAGGITANQADTSTYSGVISGDGALVKTGGGSLVLSGPSNFTGGVLVSAGTLRLMDPASAGTGQVRVATGGTLVVGAPLNNPISMSGGTLGAALGTSQIPITSGDLTITGGATIAVITADPEPPGARADIVLAGTLRGTGTIHLLPSGGVAGADYASGFRLHGPVESDFTGMIHVSNFVKFEMQSGVTGIFRSAGSAKIVMDAGTAFGPARFGSYSQLNLRNNSDGDTEFGNDVEISGSGLANFGPVGTAPSGTVIRLGNLKISDGQIAAVNKTAGPGQTVEFASVTLGGGEAVFSPKTPGFGFQFGSDLRLGPIAESVAGSGIAMDGEGELTLLGPNFHTGPTRINRGITRLAGAGALPAGAALVLDGGTLDVSDASGVSRSFMTGPLSGIAGVLTNSATDGVREFVLEQSADTTFGGTISDGLSVVKRGAGTLTLTGSSIRADGLIVEGGRLIIGAVENASAYSTRVTVQMGGSLGGHGSTGAAAIMEGGRIAPGNSVGILRTSTLILAPGAVFEAEINGVAPATEYDQLRVDGLVIFAPGALLDIRLGFDPEDNVDVFTVLLSDGVDPINGYLSQGGQILAEGAHFTVNNGGYLQNFSITYSGGDGNDVEISAVPEPGVLSFLIAAGAGMLAYRRRR